MPSIIVAVVVAAIAGLSICYLVRPQPLLVQGEVDATRLDIAARVADRLAGGRDCQGKTATGLRGTAASAAPPTWRAGIPPRSRRSTGRRTTWLAHVPTSPRRKPTHDAVAGPTREERAIADAQVKAAASALAVLERRLDNCYRPDMKH